MTRKTRIVETFIFEWVMLQWRRKIEFAGIGREYFCGGVTMALKNFKFEYEDCSDRDGNSDKLISLEIKNDRYYFEYSNGNNFCLIDITSKIDRLYQGLLAMNINEWNQQSFDGPMDMFPGFFWELEIIADDINVSCDGKDNLPKNWNEFKILLCEVGIDSNFPF